MEHQIFQIHPFQIYNVKIIVLEELYFLFKMIFYYKIVNFKIIQQITVVL